MIRNKVLILTSGFIILILILGIRYQDAIINYSANYFFTKVYSMCMDSNKDKQKKGECLRDLAKKMSVVSSVRTEVSIGKMQHGEFRLWCHEYMHYLGWEEYKKQDNLVKAYLGASGACDGGMYHGITEGYINDSVAKYSMEELMNSVIPGACEVSFTENLSIGMKGYCYHGLGHTFMFLTDNDIVEALPLCDKVPDPMGCYSGVFMENIQPKQVGRTGVVSDKYKFDRNNPDFPCSLLNERYKKVCYSFKGGNGLNLESGVEYAFESCKEVDSRYANDCYLGVGLNIPNPNITNAEAAKSCNYSLGISKKAYEMCISGALYFVVNKTLGSAYEADKFCGAVNSQLQRYCYKLAGDYLSSWVSRGASLEDKCSYMSSARAREVCGTGKKN